MTEIKRKRRGKADRANEAMRVARRLAEKKSSDFHQLITLEDRREEQRNKAAVRRYAKKHGLELSYHRKPWIFRRIEGRIQIAMPAGYFAKVDGVLQQIIAT